MAGTVAPPEAFDFTATGILGEKRDTMLENQLLLRVSACIPQLNYLLLILHNMLNGLIVYTSIPLCAHTFAKAVNIHYISSYVCMHTPYD